MNKEYFEIMKNKALVLKNAANEMDVSIQYARVCLAATEFLDEVQGQYDLPVPIREIYGKLGIEILPEEYNDSVDNNERYKFVNRTIGRVSLRPDYFSDQPEARKVTVYVASGEKTSTVNYALAHELAHIIYSFNKPQLFYTNMYCTMPLLPKSVDELIADAFAIFLMIPLDKFLVTFYEYVLEAKARGAWPITTEKWLNYLSAVMNVPYYYVACGYQQLRQVAYLIYKADSEIRKENFIDREEFNEKKLDEAVKRLYKIVSLQLGEQIDEIIKVLYQ